MPNKNTFLQNAIKDIDNNEPIWFTDLYTNPNTITKHLLSEENKYDNRKKTTMLTKIRTLLSSSIQYH